MVNELRMGLRSIMRRIREKGSCGETMVKSGGNGGAHREWAAISGDDSQTRVGEAALELANWRRPSGGGRGGGWRWH